MDDSAIAAASPDDVALAVAAQERLLSRLYQRWVVTQLYSRSRGLTAAERVIAGRFDEDLRGRDVLELGVGGGRVARELAPIARRYVGVDRFAQMIDESRQRLAVGEYQVADMRDLSAFPDGAFHSVLAPANVVDAVGDADRLRTLAEVHRVLERQGLFVFSAHNRRYVGDRDGPRLRFTRHPVGLVYRLASYLAGQINWRRRRRDEVRTDTYAIRTDSGHSYGVLHYHVNREHQVAQLRDSGFDVVACFASNGHQIPVDGACDDAASDSIHYACRRR
jgi:SAM-dependent methyltransferase